MGLTWQQKKENAHLYREVNAFDTDECSDVVEHYDFDARLDDIREDVLSAIDLIKSYQTDDALEELEILAQKLS
jgi:hypothetical protein